MQMKIEEPESDQSKSTRDKTKNTALLTTVSSGKVNLSRVVYNWQSNSDVILFTKFKLFTLS